MRPPTAARSLVRRTFLTLAVLGMAACGTRTPEHDDEEAGPMELTSGREIDDVIVTLWKDGGERVLSDIVGIEFDDLLVFPEGTPAGRVNEAAGGELLGGKYYQSSAQLFLFRTGGRATLAAMISSDVFEHEVQNAAFGPEVRIVALGDRQLVTLED
ncbi:hypothetical protein GCM10023160_02500 [Brachybacterium paraconglomeratum]|uniref:hypothetical protein n=1 Tax=Brachybacterium paraconglomeratum TaxID=173362 RepID=UPI0031EC3344